MNSFNVLSSRILTTAVACGLIGLIACGIGALTNFPQTMQSYLVAFVYCTGLSLGALGILLLQYVTGGGWGIVIRRILEAASLNILIMSLFAIPVLAGMNYLYVWTVHTSNFINVHFLNAPFFAARTLAYFVIWAALAWSLRRGSLLRDGANYAGSGPETISAIGLVVFVLTVTLASIDWIMSLEPDWSSTIFGVLVMTSQALAAVSVCIVVLCKSKAAESVPDDVFHDLGNLILMFVLLWGYMAFSQYLVVWSGNLPDETSWYLHRRSGGWPWVANALILFHFAVPFFLMLFRSVKRNRRRLFYVACVILAVHFVDSYWLIMPAFHPDGHMLFWQDAAALLGVGGMWVAGLVYWINSAPLFVNAVMIKSTDVTMSPRGVL